MIIRYLYIYIYIVYFNITVLNETWFPSQLDSKKEREIPLTYGQNPRDFDQPLKLTIRLRLRHMGFSASNDKAACSGNWQVRLGILGEEIPWVMNKHLIALVASRHDPCSWWRFSCRFCSPLEFWRDIFNEAQSSIRLLALWRFWRRLITLKHHRPVRWTSSRLPRRDGKPLKPPAKRPPKHWGSSYRPGSEGQQCGSEGQHPPSAPGPEGQCSELQNAIWRPSCSCWRTRKRNGKVRCDEKVN